MISILVGVFFLAISGINLYLPNVGNDFDTFRTMFSLVAFVVGWVILIRGVVMKLEEYGD